MKKRVISLILVLLMVFELIPSAVSEAKTIKKLENGGYIVEYKSASVKSKKLVIKGKVQNWERAASTPEYSKSGTFKFKLAKNCEFIDGYKDSEETITVSKFNKLCKKKDSDHTSIAFMIENNKVTLVRFW